MAQRQSRGIRDDGVRCCIYCRLPLPTLETGVAGKEVRIMTNERIISALELLTLEVKEQALESLKNDPEWMETTLQAENVKVWANNLIQTEVTGIVENADNIQSLEETIRGLESKIEEMNQEDDICQVDDRVDTVESRLDKIEARIDSVTREEVAEMMRQAFQGGIDAHWHILNDGH